MVPRVPGFPGWLRILLALLPALPAVGSHSLAASAGGLAECEFAPLPELEAIRDRAIAACEVAATVPPIPLLAVEAHPDEAEHAAYWGMATARCFEGVGRAAIGNLEDYLVDLPRCTLESTVDGFTLTSAAMLCHVGVDGGCRFFLEYLDAQIESKGGSCVERKVRETGVALANGTRAAGAAVTALTRSYSQVTSEAARLVSRELKEFACLPASIKSYYVCRAIGEIGTDPAILLTQINTVSRVSRAAATVASRVVAELRHGTELLRIGQGSLVQRVNQAGRISMEYRKKVKVGGREVWDEIPVPYDATLRTFRIEGRNPLLADLIGQAGARAGAKQSHFVSIDVNFLGAVNDFGKLHQAGDQYLEATMAAVRAELRDSDLLFRLGGDEFGFVLDGMTVAEVEAKFQAIRRRLAASPKLRSVFEDERARLDGLIVEARRAGDAAKLRDLEARRELVGRYPVEGTLALGHAPITAGARAEDVMHAADRMALDCKLRTYAACGLKRNKGGGK